MTPNISIDYNLSTIKSRHHDYFIQSPPDSDSVEPKEIALTPTETDQNNTSFIPESKPHL